MEETYLKQLIQKSGLKEVYIYERLGVSKTKYMRMRDNSHELALVEAKALAQIFDIPVLKFVEGILSDYEAKPHLYAI